MIDKILVDTNIPADGLTLNDVEDIILAAGVSFDTDNHKIDLDNGGTYRFEGAGNLGYADLRRLSEQGAEQDGDTDNGFLYNPRFFDLVVKVVGVGQTHAQQRLTYQSARREIIKRFLANDMPLTLKLTLADGAERWLDFHYITGLQFGHNERNITFSDAVIQCKANRPFLYNPTEQVLTFQFPDVNGLDVPFDVPVPIGTDQIDETQNAVYAGDIVSYPFIKVENSMTRIVITNEATGDRIELNSPQGEGDITYFNLDYNAKTVYDDAGNQLDGLLSDSDMATFGIEPFTVVPGGTNPITVLVDGATTTTVVTITYLEWYAGI